MAAKIECINKIKDIWAIRVGYGEDDLGDYCFEERFNGKPSSEEIRKTILSHYNQQCDEEILSGFEFEENPVWLSSENQFNYKAAFDLAVQTGGASLPVKFKFGTDTESVYRTFLELPDLQVFIVQALGYVSSTLDKYWQIKDSIDWSKYD